MHIFAVLLGETFFNQTKTHETKKTPPRLSRGSVFASGVAYSGSDPVRVLISADHVVLRNESKDLLAQRQIIVSR